MMSQIIRVFFVLALPSSLAVLYAQAPASISELRITGAVSTPLAVNLADLKKMPRKTLSVVNPHNKKTEVYEGVLLEELLRRAGVAQGEHLRGPAMATYVVAEGADGYRVVFSLPNLTRRCWTRK
jgi:DMSO/TMAO reductase YedYZ molybdopterin-dependent catalytic subunit